MNDTVWLFWEGSMPPFIRLCADLLQLHNPTTRLVGPADLPALGIDPAELAHLNVVQKSDVIRALLLEKHGGTWCDIDCIPFKPFWPFHLMAAKSRFGICAWDSTDDTIGNNLYASVAGGPIAIEHAKRLERFRRGEQPGGWTQAGTGTLTPIVREFGITHVPRFPLNLVQPVSWREQERYSVRATDAEHAGHVAVHPAAFCYMLSNAGLGQDVRGLTRHELLTSDRFISHLFRESIGRLTPPPPRHGRAVITLNLYGDGMPANFRASHQAAAERWGAEYVEITLGLFGWQDAYWEKLNLDKHAAGYERVVFVDRDLVIRADCPSPFDLVDRSEVGAVLNEQPGWSKDPEIPRHMAPLVQTTGVALDSEREYFNTGLIVFEPALHSQAFELARCLSTLHGNRHWVVSDQGCLSLALKMAETPVHVLPAEFNRIGHSLWEQWQPRMTDYLWHFAGPKNWDRMCRTEWST